ncbi:uncharacterized protein LOC111333760 [Stylophora pistillata]|uniref:uncharacterized protein LOC111333760 n=1 Tax=Stylophora pistillata TaxID=50429 RepID=UPI000C04B944|nr:uncharacterized protein LOC111333760 [Stylophora pistillata]
MTIHVPNTLLPGINRVHLRLLDTKCKAEEDDNYYSLTTSLTGCKTTRKHTTTAVLYSNMVLKVPTVSKKAMIRELKIEFSCVYSSHGVVSSVGWRAVNRKVIISEEGEENFRLVLNMFPHKKFGIPYKEKDFPLFVAQKRLFLEVSVITDKRLSIIADQCYTTPTRKRENAPRVHSFMLARRKKRRKAIVHGASNEKNASDTTFVVGLVMICVAYLAAMGTGLVIFKKLRDKRSAAEVFSGHEKESLNIDDTDWTGLNWPWRKIEFEKHIKFHLDAQLPLFKFSMRIRYFA